MATREYQFVVGPETSTLPAIGTPSAESDLISLGYGNSRYTRGRAPVADITALKAIADSGTYPRQDGELVIVRSTNTAYIFDADNVVAGDDNSIVAPTSGTGRWVKVRENQLGAELALATDANGNIVVVAGVTATELGYLSAVTSDIQGQLNAKGNLSGGNTWSGAQVFSDTTESTDKDTGSLVLQGGLGVEKNLNVGGNVVITGDLTVQGTQTILNTSILQSEDTNIQLNFGGNDATSEGAGLTVERTGTKGSFVYENALASKWKAGALGSESEVMTVGSAQTVSGTKTHSGNMTMQAVVKYDEETDATTTGANASIASVAKTIHRLTNASLSSLAMIAGGATGRYFMLVNKTGAQIQVKNDTGGTASDRILTGTGVDLQLANDGAIHLAYDNTNSRWRIVGGSGASSSAVTITAGETLATGDVVYIASSGKAFKIDNTNDAKIEFFGICLIGAATDSTAVIQVSGEITNSGWSFATLGEPVYGLTAGASQSAPNTTGHWMIQIGIAKTATSLVINAAGSATAIKIGTDGGPAFSSGGVVFGTGTSSTTDATTLFWDNTNKRLGIGTNAPAAKNHVVSSSSTASLVDVGTTRFAQYIDSTAVYLCATAASGTGAKDFIFQTNPSGGSSLGIERIRITSDGRLYGTALHNNAGSVAGTTNQYIASGTYTPICAALQNLDSHPTGFTSQWLRVGNVVTVSGKVDVDPINAGNTATIFNMSLPIVSEFTFAEQLSGSFNSLLNNSNTEVKADVVNNRAYITFASGTTVSTAGFFHFTYLIL